VREGGSLEFSASEFIEGSLEVIMGMFKVSDFIWSDLRIVADPALVKM